MRVLGTEDSQTARTNIEQTLAEESEHPPCGRGRTDYKLLIFGGSAGGPKVLYQLLAAAPAPYFLPILIGQHILRGFEEGFAAWLSQTGHQVTVVKTGDRLIPGAVYVLPPHMDCILSLFSIELRPLASTSASAYRPSIDNLFVSAAHSFGEHVIAILLSGMGDDGVQGMHKLRRAGALTISQSRDSCIIASMPAAAIEQGASAFEFHPTEMSRLLSSLHHSHKPRP